MTIGKGAASGRRARRALVFCALLAASLLMLCLGVTQGSVRIPAGDVARILLYVYCCWGQPNLYSDLSSDLLPAQEKDSTDNGKKAVESLDTLLSWCESDPVDTWEMRRNDLIESIQGNRNVFIDYPELAEYIWGNKQGTAVDFHLLQQSYGDAYNETATAIPGTRDHKSAARKELREGKIIIIFQNSTIYNTLGQPIQ